jgi:hypothetical protein
MGRADDQSSSKTVSDQKLRSLLSATRESTSINSLDVTFGISTGAVVGAALSIPLSLYAFDNRLAPIGLDQFGFVFLCLMIALVFGAVSGGAISFLATSRRVAREKLSAACQKYPIEFARLNETTALYGHRVAGAAVHVVRSGSAFKPQLLETSGNCGSRTAHRQALAVHDRANAQSNGDDARILEPSPKFEQPMSGSAGLRVFAVYKGVIVLLVGIVGMLGVWVQIEDRNFLLATVMGFATTIALFLGILVIRHGLSK